LHRSGFTAEAGPFPVAPAPADPLTPAACVHAP
jgi:hypothetical protein